MSAPSSPVLCGKRKRAEYVYDVAPLMAPAEFVPFFAETPESAESLARYLEREYRNRFSVELVVDGSEPRVVFTYPPAYLFDFGVTAREPHSV
jgi:hypothetical protein